MSCLIVIGQLINVEALLMRKERRLGVCKRSQRVEHVLESRFDSI
jgi:hypothetical protein